MDIQNHEAYKEEYVEYDEFKGVYAQLEGYDKLIDKENKVGFPSLRQISIHDE